MPSYFGYPAILARGFTSPAINLLCDNSAHHRPLLVILTCGRRHFHEQHQASHQLAPPKREKGLLQANLVETVQNKYNLFNQQYERLTGISEIRKIQDKVLEAESDFVDITQKRKSCQDQIDGLKEKLGNLRDKLESTPRSSESYLQLITNEHKLLREQLSLDVQLTQLKEREQLSFDAMSKLLRQSHELERLRQERSKYWQIISISLSLACSLVALIAQKARNQQSVLKRMDLFETKLLEIERLEQTSVLESEKNSQIISTKLDKLDSKLELVIADKLEPKFDNRSSRSEGNSSWVTYVPGLSILTSWIWYYI